MNKALAPVSALLMTLFAIGAAGLLILVAGSWALAGTLTRPLSALEAAAQRLRRGEEAQVEVTTDDEIARLASSFNAMARDIRDREERLERARDLAEAANRAKSSFLANMSHEVRTPLNGVIGVAGVLAGTALDDKQRNMVTIIESSAGTLQRVLSDVLDLARMEAGRANFLAEPFDLAEVVKVVARGAEIQAGAKGLAFNLERRWRIPSLGDRRPGAAGADPGQSRRQCAEVHGSRPYRAGRQPHRRGLPLRGSRHRDRVRSRPHRAAVPALPAGGRWAEQPAALAARAWA